MKVALPHVKLYGEEVLVFGRVAAASIDDACVDVSVAAQYERLAPAFFLEKGTYAGLGPVQRIGA